MAYVINDNCVACGTCAAACPVEAISEGDIYKIDPDTCISCGTCAEGKLHRENATQNTAFPNREDAFRRLWNVLRLLKKT